MTAASVNAIPAAAPKLVHASAAPYAQVVAHLLPGAVQTQLLEACLRTGDAAAEAWAAFVASVGDPKTYFEQDQTGLKGLLPFVESSLTHNGVDAGKPFHTYARVALVREELRARIYQEILAATLTAFETAGVSALLVKGGAVAATVYPPHTIRHSHAIDLLVEPQQFAAADQALRHQQFSPAAVGPGAACHRDYRHTSGLALGLHSRLLFLPQFEIAQEIVRGRAQSIRVGSVGARVMAPEDNLVHVCGHALYSRSRSNLRWACDAFFLLTRTKGFHWQRALEIAEQANLALPLFVQLGWLRDTLSAPVAPDAMTALAQRAVLRDGDAEEGIYAALLHSTGSRRRALAYCRGSLRTTLGFVRFGTVPSPGYMRWRYNVTGTMGLVLQYVRRVARFLRRVIVRRGRSEVGVAMSSVD